jgi:hypothetical protein
MINRDIGILISRIINKTIKNKNTSFRKPFWGLFSNLTSLPFFETFITSFEF